MNYIKAKFFHVTKYQKEVPTDRGISKVGSGLPGYISSKQASIQSIPKKEGGWELQIRGLKLQKRQNKRPLFFAIQSKIKLKEYTL